MAFEHDYNKYPELTNKQIEEYGFTSPHAQLVEDFDAEVVKVIDGDTISLKTTLRDFVFPLRLLDINAPEMNEGGEVARAWLLQRILNKKVDILINKDNRIDKYGRLLGYVFHGGMDVGEEELRLGLVTTFEDRKEGKLPNLDKELSIKKWL